MLLVNRCAVLVGLAQPYIDWAAALDEDGEGPRDAGERTVYLVSDLEDEEEDLLELVYAQIFERELAAWCTDDSTWPKSRTLEMFQQWFDVEVIDAVEDLGDDPIETLDDLDGEFEDDGYFPDDEFDGGLRSS